MRTAYVRATCVSASRAGCTFSELSSRDPMLRLRLSPGFIANADEVIERTAQCPLLAQSGHRMTEFQCSLLGVKRTSLRHASMSASDSKRTPDDRADHCARRTSEIGNLQQPAVADPRSGQVSLGLVSGSGVAARLIQFRKSEVRPSISRRSGERTLELLLRLIEAASLQQSSGKRLPDRVIPIRRLSIW